MSTLKELEVAIEAILFVSAEPVPRHKLLETFDEAHRDTAAEALEALLERYKPSPDSGVYAEEVGGGLRIVTRPELNSYLRRFFEASGKNKLSMAALETLAIVAYRQPITGPEVQELRGVNSSGVVKTLLEKRLIRIAGRKEVVGKPFLYGTTREFLMHFGLHKLGELPPLEEFEEALGLDAATLSDGDGVEDPDDASFDDAELEDTEEADSEQEAVQEDGQEAAESASTQKAGVREAGSVEGENVEAGEESDAEEAEDHESPQAEAVRESTLIESAPSTESSSTEPKESAEAAGLEAEAAGEVGDQETRKVEQEPSADQSLAEDAEEQPEMDSSRNKEELI